MTLFNTFTPQKSMNVQKRQSPSVMGIGKHQWGTRSRIRGMLHSRDWMLLLVDVEDYEE